MKSSWPSLASVAVSGARRMAETAAHLVDHVIPRVPMRQWVLSFPILLRLLYYVDTGGRPNHRRILLSSISSGDGSSRATTRSLRFYNSHVTRMSGLLDVGADCRMISTCLRDLHNPDRPVVSYL